MRTATKIVRLEGQSAADAAEQRMIAKIDAVEAAIKSAIEAAAEAAKGQASMVRRRDRGVAAILIAAIGTGAAAWHWWAPLAAICGAVWRAATGAL